MPLRAHSEKLILGHAVRIKIWKIWPSWWPGPTNGSAKWKRWSYRYGTKRYVQFKRYKYICSNSERRKRKDSIAEDHCAGQRRKCYLVPHLLPRVCCVLSYWSVLLVCSCMVLGKSSMSFWYSRFKSIGVVSDINLLSQSRATCSNPQLVWSQKKFSLNCQHRIGEEG